jgi:hypothetical protein
LEEDFKKTWGLQTPNRNYNALILGIFNRSEEGDGDGLEGSEGPLKRYGEMGHGAR